MAPTRHCREGAGGADRVRHELLTALHFGRLRPGDRVPSVRRLARKTGVNRKTVHRAYTRLAEEGLLDLRPGSGTFVAERAGADGLLSAGSLLAAVNRARATAAGLGLEPARFARFLDAYLGDGLHGVPMLVAECNQEQAELIAGELRSVLGLDTRAVLLDRLSKEEAGRRFGIVTTDCHLAEVEAMAEPWHVTVHRVALDPGFPRRIAECARRGHVVSVVRDAGFAPVFLNLLRQLELPDELLERVHVCEPTAARRLLLTLPDVAVLHVSPTVEDEPLGSAADALPRLRLRWRIDPGALDRLRARLAFETTSRVA